MAILVGQQSVNDTLTGTDGEANAIYGDAVSEMGNAAQNGNDTLTGGANSPDNTIYGDAGSFTADITGGNDTLIGGANSTNTLVGDAGSTTGPGHGGDDRLVSADNSPDSMWGDFKTFNSNNTTFGHDTFVFGPHNGNDIINDFSAGNLSAGVADTIELDGFFKNGNGHIPSHVSDHLPPQAAAHVLESFSDLNIQHVDTNNDGTLDSVIQFDATDSVTVLNDTNLTASDFHFVA